MVGFVRNIATMIVANRKKIATIFVGHSVWSITSWVYDNPLYIASIAKFGPVVGGTIMTAGSLAICLLTLLYYRNKKVDWLGYDLAAEMLAKHINLKSKAFDWFGDTLAFFILSIWEDPFITTAYLRHGRTTGLTANDFAIFFASVVFSNGYWILRTTAVIEIAKIVWHFLFS